MVFVPNASRNTTLKFFKKTLLKFRRQIARLSKTVKSYSGDEYADRFALVDDRYR
jgi:hypothetical protein